MRIRLDQALVDRGLAPSRNVARRLILAGQVRIDGHPAGKPGVDIGDGVELTVATPPRYVSRGGDKLEAALSAAAIAVEGRTCLDVGASTGGFVDCLLQHGAAAVVAVDVGYGQLAWKLREDPRVRVLERTNARHLSAEHLPEDLDRRPDLLTMDVSFIGALKVLPALGAVLDDDSEALLLVKPQFEAGPEEVGSGGVVREARVRRGSVAAVAEGARALGWAVAGAIPSPLRGPAGNWECFLHLRRGRGAVDEEGAVAQLEVPDDD